LNLLKKYPSVFVLLLSTIILFGFFHRVILHPDNYLFGPGGDGLKNYFTLAYYVKYDTGVHFSGMNYPYGEHVVFTDNQPLIAFILKFINTNLFPVENHTHGIINLLMLFAIPLTCFFIFRILRFFNLPFLYSLLVCIPLGFLSPQMQRLTGHYALSYMFFVPMIWYFILQMSTSRNVLKWICVISLVSTAFILIHLYYALIAGAFLLAYLLITLVSKNLIHQSFWKTVFAFVIPALIPIMVMQIFMHFTDSITDRPDNPWGIYAYKASFESVFLPAFGPVLKLIQKVIHVRSANWEGISFVGMTGSLVFLVSLFLMIKNLIKSKWKKVFQFNLPPALFVSLWASVLVLFFSMAFPFRLGMDFLLDWISPLKQFRSLGRMAWVFYYVLTVFSAYSIYQWYRAIKIKKKNFIAYSLVAVLIFGWCIDAFINTQDRSKVILQNNYAQEFFSEEQSLANDLKEHGLSADDFQAVLTFPFFCIGSEIITIDRSGASSWMAMKAAYNLHLPIATGMLSRTSRSQALKIAQLMSDDFIGKEVLKDYTNGKPLLLVITDEEKTEQEIKLISRGDSLFRIENKTFCRLPLSAFAFDLDSIKSLAEDSGCPVIYLSQLVTSSYSSYYFNDQITFGKDSGAYEASLWIDINDPFDGFPAFKFDQVMENHAIIDVREVVPKFQTNIYQNQIRIAFKFILYNKNNRVQIYSEPIDEWSYFAHSLLIKPVECHFERPLMLDNFWIEDTE